MEMTTTISFDEASLQQAIINGAIRSLCADAKFREQAAKALAAHAWAEGTEFKSEFRKDAREKQQEQTERLEKELTQTREHHTERANQELRKKYDEAVRRYATANLPENEIREIAIEAVRSQVRRAFGRRAAQLANEVIGSGDRLELLLSDEMGGE